MDESQEQRELEQQEHEQKSGLRPSQWGVIALVLALTSGAILYRALFHEHLGHTAAIFLGIPAVLAIILALTPKAKTLIGGVMKGITLFLLIVAPLLGEGYICILIASPLFYLVGMFVALGAEAFRNRRKATVSCVALVLLPMCLEGVVPELTWNREQSVEVTRVVAAPADAVEATLAKSPRVLHAKMPAFVPYGAPIPLDAWGEGLSVGANRTIHFAGAEGDPPGNLVMRVAERQPGYARFETVSDGSKLAQWVLWESSEVWWSPVDADHARITWRIHFARQLDPAWYFTPWERAAVRESANFLIAVNATPESAAK
jgi:hypothetical protein